MDTEISLDELTDRATRAFETRFGRSPRWRVAAPGRVNIIGEHTDYNDGFVLPMGIERYTVIAADRAAHDGDAPVAARLFSATLDEEVSVAMPPSASPSAPGWARYVEGVIAGCLDHGMEPVALDVVIDSTVPLGGGLSSSAALEVATATLMEAVSGHSLGKLEKALLCQQAEHRYAGVPCGIMDQFTSVLAEPDCLLLVDCRSHVVSEVPFTDPALTVLIIHTGVQHELAGGEYAARRRQCEAAARGLGISHLRDATLEQLEVASGSLAPVFYRRARHVISENDRTERAAAAAADGHWDTLGELMYASHASLRDDYEVSCEELDLLVELASACGRERGVMGSRMTGGGFGGCTVSLVRTDRVGEVADSIAGDYARRTGIEPVVFSSRPAGGARRL